MLANVASQTGDWNIHEQAVGTKVRTGEVLVGPGGLDRTLHEPDESGVMWCNLIYWANPANQVHIDCLSELASMWRILLQPQMKS